MEGVYRVQGHGIAACCDDVEQIDECEQIMTPPLPDQLPCGRSNTGTAE